MSDFNLRGANPQAGFGLARQLMVLGGTFAITTGMLASAKTTDLFDIPEGFTPVRFRFIPSDMDTNGTPTLVLAVGDSGDDDRLITANTGGQTGTATLDALVASTGFLYRYPAQSVAILKATTAAATAVAGTLTALLEGYIA